MSPKKVINLLPIVFFFIIVTIPIIKMPRDMWDGSIIEYASHIKDFNGLKSWFIESGWYFQYPLSIFIIKISDIIGITYKNTNAVFILLFMFILSRETILFGTKKIKLSINSAIFASILTTTFSVWSVLASSVMTIHLGCMAMGLLFVRLINDGNILSKNLSYIGLIFVYTLQSLLIFLPILSYIYDLFSEKNKLKNNKIILPSINTFIIFTIGVILFTCARYFFPSSGLYENYNEIINFQNPFNAIKISIYNFLRYLTYLIPITVVAILLIFIGLFAGNLKNNFFNNINYKHYKWIICLLLLFVAGVTPYIAVGKSSVLWDVTDWNNRQALLLAFPVSLLSALTVEIFKNFNSNGIIYYLNKIGVGMLLILNISLLVWSITYKSNRQVFEQELENIIKKNKNQIEEGMLQIIGNGIPGPTFRVYEANFLMFNVIGKANWWVRIDKNYDAKFSIPCHLKEKKYQQKYVYNYNENHHDKYTILKIQVLGFKKISDLFLNSLKFTQNRSIELISIDEVRVTNNEKNGC